MLGLRAFDPRCQVIPAPLLKDDRAAKKSDKKSNEVRKMLSAGSSDSSSGQPGSSSGWAHFSGSDGLFKLNSQFATMHRSMVETFTVVEEDSPVDLDQFNEWLPTVLRDHGQNIYRLKGFLHAAGEPRRLVLQGVHMTFTGERGQAWGKGEKRKSTLVVIGRKPLPRNELLLGFRKCLVESRMHGSLFGGGSTTGGKKK